MKRIYSAIALLLIHHFAFSQGHVIGKNPEVIKGRLTRVADPFHKDPKFNPKIVRTERGIIEKNGKVENDEYTPPVPFPHLQQKEDGALQKNTTGGSQATSPNTAIPGLGYTSVCPADPTLAVGPNHVVQMINGGSGAYFEVWNKTGGVILGKTLLGTITNTQGLGDGVALYDQLADRFILTEFENNSNALIIAVSQTPDPAGAYYTYVFPTVNFPDYPKYAIWNNAYYAKTNDFNGNTFKGVSVYAFDRTAMLAGNPNPTVQKFTLGTANQNYSMCPVGLVGTALPPAGSGGLFAYMSDNSWTGTGTDSIGLLEFKPDFTTPANSTLTSQHFATAAYNPSANSVKQPGRRSQTLDALANRVMNQPVYRNFSTFQSLALAFTVNTGTVAGIRWMELRNNSGVWSVNQQSTYSRSDGQSRWMPSINIDKNGNIGLGFNVSGSSVYPSIRYTGRANCDALNTMTVSESTIYAGTAASNCYNRYGDYNHLVVDPSDNSTFWFTAMYNKASSWSTGIGSFTIPACSSPVQSTEASNKAITDQSATTLQVYPNPVHDVLTIVTPNNGTSAVEVVDMNGKLIKGNTMSGNKYLLDVSGLKPGIYLLKVRGTKDVKYLKFTKE